MYFPGLLREWLCCVLVTALSPQTDQTSPTFIIRERSNKLTNTNNILQQQQLCTIVGGYIKFVSDIVFYLSNKTKYVRPRLSLLKTDLIEKDED